MCVCLCSICVSVRVCLCLNMRKCTCVYVRVCVVEREFVCVCFVSAHQSLSAANLGKRSLLFKGL